MAKRAKFKAYAGGNIHLKKFSDSLESLTGKKSAATVFYDFLKVSAITLSNTFDPENVCTPAEVKQERENLYLQIINDYGADAQLLADMFAHLQLELDINKNIGYRDVLGQLLTAMQLNDEGNDQFFTPTHIAELMGQLAFSDKDFTADIKKRGYGIIKEPTCGGGALVFGGVEAFKRQGFNPEQQLVVIATDLDERCVLMTYVQCAMYNIPAMIQQRNFMEDKSLSPPWFTPMFVAYRWDKVLASQQPLWAPIKDMPPIVEEEKTQKKTKKKPPVVKEELGQTSLF